MITAGLDEKQKKTYIVICSSVLLWCINKKGDYIEDKEKITNEVTKRVFKTTTNKDVTKSPLIQKLKFKGSQDQLRMFLSGKAGSGTSRFIKTILACLRMFCNKCDIPFDSNIVKVTAFTGVAAAQFKILGATTIHKAAHLNSKSPKTKGSDWVNTILIFVDKISFMSTPTCEKLDRRLRIQTGKMDKLFGEIHIIFAGDFFSDTSSLRRK